MLLQIVNPLRLIQNHEIPEPVCYPLRSWRCMLFAAVCESGQGERDIAGDGDSATKAKSTRPTAPLRAAFQNQACHASTLSFDFSFFGGWMAGQT